MRLHLVTPPSVEPVTLAEAKNHRKVTHTADDEEILGLIAAATDLFEGETGRQLITATWRGTMDGFPPSWEPIRVLRAPLQSVTSITYVDGSGDTQTWDSSLYTVRTFAGPFATHGLIHPVAGESYPSTRRITDAVTVTFVAGYGAADSVPGAAKAAIKELIGGLYENRESDEEVMLHTNPAYQRVVTRFRLPVYA